MKLNLILSRSIAPVSHRSTTPPPPHHKRFTVIFPVPPGWAGARRELLDFVVQGKINRGRHTDHPPRRHSIWTNQCPPPPSSKPRASKILYWGLCGSSCYARIRTSATLRTHKSNSMITIMTFTLLTVRTTSCERPLHEVWWDIHIVGHKKEPIYFSP